MKFLTAVVLIVVIIAGAALAGLHVFVNMKGEELLLEKLEGTFDRKASLKSISTSFPTNLHVKGVEVEGLFTIDKVDAKGGVFDVFRKTFNLSLLRVIRPKITIERSFIESAAASFGAKDKTASKEPTVKKETTTKATTDVDPMKLAKGDFLSPAFVLKRLIVEDGTLYFIDREVSDKGLSIEIKDVDIEAKNINLSSSGSRRTPFKLEGNIPWPTKEGKGRIELNGWIEYFQKNMDANLKLSNMDYISFKDYYPPFWKPDNLGISEATFTLEAKLDSENNNMTVDCVLSVDKIAFVKVEESDNEELYSRIKTIRTMLGLFKGTKEKPSIHFVVKTKMDSPQFDLSSLKESFQANFKMGPQMMLDMLFGKVKQTTSPVTETATDVKEVTVDKFVDTMKSIGKRFKDMFTSDDDAQKKTTDH